MRGSATTTPSILLGLCAILTVCPAVAVDLENGEEINEVCAGCHGEFGQGGKGGEYPRLAGMPADFIAKQPRLFRDRKRSNIAMIEYVDHRQMPGPDINDVSAYLAAIMIPSKLPPIDENDPDIDALERFLQAKRIVQIPRAEGNIEAGRKLYNRECASCHARDALGDMKDAVPMLAGQYTNYLWRQVDKYLKGYRVHDEDDPDDEILAHLSRSKGRGSFRQNSEPWPGLLSTSTNPLCFSATTFTKASPKPVPLSLCGPDLSMR